MILQLVVLVVVLQVMLVEMVLGPEGEEEELNLLLDLEDLVEEEHFKEDQVQQVVEVDIMVVLEEILSLDVVLMVQVEEDPLILME